MDSAALSPAIPAMRTIRRLIAVGVLMAVAACTGGQPGTASDPNQDAAAITSSSDLGAPTAQQDEGRSEARLPDPATLIGQTREDVTGLLGEPVFVRRDPPAEFWRYRHRTCVLELFFFERDGQHRLDHMATRQSALSATEDARKAQCLQALIATRAPS